MIRQVLRRVRGPVDAALGPSLGSIVSVDTTRDELALTFDDGPHEVVTPELAAILAEHGAHATFFVLITRVRRSPGMVRELAASGHEIALHGMDHRRITTLPLREVDTWLRDAKDALEQELGQSVRWFRPPHGAQSPQHRVLMVRHGLRPVLWSGTTWDWKDVTPEQRLERAMSDARRGAILLAHDGAADASDLATDPAVEGVDKPALLRQVLSGFDERGLRSVTLDDLLTGGRPVSRLSFSA